jgi:UDP-N-acetylglucosamine--N-acetylmuramyl-(pentapeptide) pyrophosphoryl-undecaprenol N-acetylglucosamine transferase
VTGPILLAAGGTGGHVFPAAALARELKARGREVALVTDARGERYDETFAGFAVHRVASGTPTGRDLLGRAAAVGAIAKGVLQARGLFRRLRPAAAIGFGGYPSLPTMMAALGRLPTAIHEQNAVLGRVNRLIAPRVGRIALSFAETTGLDERARRKATLTGNPVRLEVANLPPYAPPTGEFRLLAFGGSQGARIMGEVVPTAICLLPDELRARLRLAQQARPEDIDEVRAAYEEIGVSAEVAPFFADLPARLAAAHLVVARAGAGTVSELACAGRPSILAPYLFATDDHQTANARALVEAGGAWMLRNGDFNANRLATLLAELAAAPDRLAAAAAAALGVGAPDAAARLADLVERLAPANGAMRRAA